MAYYRNGTFVPDPWETPAEGERLLLTPAEWEERREDERRGGQPARVILGLAVQPGFAVETLERDIDRFELITLAFPKFTDGRAYSMAWILRSRLGYQKELRAVGDVLFDEMQLMLRCGFDAFDIADDNTLRLLREGRTANISRFYQPGLEPEMPAGTRPWARRQA